MMVEGDGEVKSEAVEAGAGGRPAKRWRSRGRLAKTARIDAAMLALFGRLPDRRRALPLEHNLQQLKDLVAARAACVEDRANRRKRIAEFGPGPTAAALGRLNDATEREIGVLDQAIAKALEADEGLARRAEILRSIAGIGTAALAISAAGGPARARCSTWPALPPAVRTPTCASSTSGWSTPVSRTRSRSPPSSASSSCSPRPEYWMTPDSPSPPNGPRRNPRPNL